MTSLPPFGDDPAAPPSALASASTPVSGGAGGRWGRWLPLVLAVLTGAGLVGAGALHEGVTRREAAVLPLEQEAVALRAQAEQQARLLEDMRPRAEAWEEARRQGAFSPLNRDTLLTSVLTLAEERRVGRLDWTLLPAASDQPAAGLTRDRLVLRLKGSALVDGDAVALVDALLARWPGRAVLRSFSLWRAAPPDAAALAAVQAGAEVALVAFEARLDFTVLSWSWADAPAPPEEGGAGGTGRGGGPVPGPEPVLLDTPEAAAPVLAALHAGPWARPPGWRDVRDFSLTGLLWSGASRWRLWLDRRALGPGDPLPPHVRILRVAPDRVTFGISRGPTDNRVVVLRPGQTYRVHLDQVERTPPSP